MRYAAILAMIGLLLAACDSDEQADADSKPAASEIRRSCERGGGPGRYP